ncbi:hypothetical protein GCM10023084_48650 [Streptomyces lacrimifluminis]|uniref:Uncharacterized protein n=2 Tax=Streptomyces lacrimifluminis TaxID=1500077 RepID=A0A917L8M9_9ACTN|nr:hypothetical protein GCM10012282_53990 [Streptomyces lacrimifluminis]
MSEVPMPVTIDARAPTASRTDRLPHRPYQRRLLRVRRGRGLARRPGEDEAVAAPGNQPVGEELGAVEVQGALGGEGGDHRAQGAAEGGGGRRGWCCHASSLGKELVKLHLILLPGIHKQCFGVGKPGIGRHWCQLGAPWATMAGTVTEQQVMGGVMRLGKALTTGVAEEQVPVPADELQLPEEVHELETSAEEAPVAR